MFNEFLVHSIIREKNIWWDLVGVEWPFYLMSHHAETNVKRQIITRSCSKSSLERVEILWYQFRPFSCTGNLSCNHWEWLSQRGMIMSS